MIYLKHSDQHKTKFSIASTTQASIYLLSTVMAITACVGMYQQYEWRKNVIEPCSYGCVNAAEKPVPTPTPTEAPATLENIVAYIAKKFEPEGKHVVVQAINCFYSESGLRPEAVNDKNSNGTVDRGIAQINSIWKMSKEDAHNYKKNIDKAFEIYKRRGNFDAWYAPGCRA